jgi:hypothetical protein
VIKLASSEDLASTKLYLSSRIQMNGKLVIILPFNAACAGAER